MKRTLNIFLIIFLLSFAVFPKSSFAAPTLTTSNLTATSVTLNSTGLTPNGIHMFGIITAGGNQESQVTADNSGNATTSFTGLIPSRDYSASVKKYNPVTHFLSSAGAPIIYFTAPVTIPPAPVPTPTPTPTTDNGGLVPCSDNCGFKDLLDMVNKVINFILIFMAVPIAAIMFAYAGFLLVFSGGEPAKRTKAKDVFVNVAIGLVIIAACWLIVHTILSIVGFDGSWIGL